MVNFKDPEHYARIGLRLALFEHWLHCERAKDYRWSRTYYFRECEIQAATAGGLAELRGVLPDEAIWSSGEVSAADVPLYVQQLIRFLIVFGPESRPPLGIGSFFVSGVCAVLQILLYVWQHEATSVAVVASVAMAVASYPFFTYFS